METGLSRVPLDVPADYFGQFGIGGMARAVGDYASADAHTDQRQIADHVQQLVARRFVRKAELDVVQVTFVDLNVLFVEKFRQPGEFFVRDLVFDDHDGVVQVASFDQVVLDQRFQFVQEDERAARGDLFREIPDTVEARILIAYDFGVEIDVDVD